MTAKRKPNYLRGWTMESLWNDLCRARADLLKSEKDIEADAANYRKAKSDWVVERAALLDQMSAIEKRHEESVAELQRRLEEESAIAKLNESGCNVLWRALRLMDARLEEIDPIRRVKS